MTLSKMMLRSLLGPIVPPPTLGACYDGRTEGEPTNGESVRDREAVAERTRQSREAVVGIECSFGRFCRNVLRRQTNTQETNDVGRRTQENRSRTKGTMGKDSGKESGIRSLGSSWEG